MRFLFIMAIPVLLASACGDSSASEPGAVTLDTAEAEPWIGESHGDEELHTVDEPHGDEESDSMDMGTGEYSMEECAAVNEGYMMALFPVVPNAQSVAALRSSLEMIDLAIAGSPAEQAMQLQTIADAYEDAFDAIAADGIEAASAVRHEHGLMPTLQLLNDFTIQECDHH